MKRASMSSVISFGWATLFLVVLSVSANAAGPPGGLSVVVENTPLPVEEVNPPAAQAVFAGTFLYFENGKAFSGDEVLLSVPEGKRLVIEYLSARVNTNLAEDKHFIIILGVGDFLNSAVFATPASAVPTAVGSKSHIISQPVKIYSDVGADISISASRGPDLSGNDALKVSIWGYLVDVPE